MTAEDLLRIAQKTPPKIEQHCLAQLRPAAFVLRQKGYQWKEIAKMLSDLGEPIPNVRSFCSCMSKAYNQHMRSLEDDGKSPFLAKGQTYTDVMDFADFQFRNTRTEGFRRRAGTDVQHKHQQNALCHGRSMVGGANQDAQ
ncbi:MAG: hypothetical protein KDN22_31955 [Verrucomicrobiae bacterium]|nr:hypothetical protein [Verrucomicrobiae bacterium]